MFANAINEHGFTNVQASVDASNRVVITHNDGGEIRIKDTSSAFANAGFSAYNYPNQISTANPYTAPTGDSAYGPLPKLKIPTYNAGSMSPNSIGYNKNGRLWYNSIVDEVDIMVHDGNTWKGYANVYPTADPAGPIVSATESHNNSSRYNIGNR